MALITSNMGLKLWNLITDIFSYSDLASNWATLDTHDHSLGKGLQIPTGGLANGAVTATKIAPATITSAQLSPTLGLTGTQIAAGTITSTQIAAGTITSTQIAATAGITVGQLTADAGRLQLVSPAGNATAQVGQMVMAAKSTTITMPPPFLPTPQGALVGVTCRDSSTTGATPVTVQTTALNTTFLGVGYGNSGSSAITTINMGSPDGFAIFMADNGSWRLVGGAWDTGWVSLTLNTNVTATLGVYSPPTVRRINDRVHLRGALTNSVSQSGGYTWATLPSVIYYPSDQVKVLPVVVGAGSNQLAVNGPSSTPGQVNVLQGGTAAGAILFLDGISYFTISE